MDFVVRQSVVILMLIITSVLCTAGYAADEFSSNALDAGQAAFNSGDFQAAFHLWQTEATSGNADAQVFVGLAYANGWGVAKSVSLASHWYLKAARNHHPTAQLLLGLHYIQKSGAYRASGLNWLQRSAEGGDATARDFLRKGHANGWFKDIKPGDSQASLTQSSLRSLALAQP